ncbi:unnamed protein product [Toxocara canis]|uniref:Large ribosomal subunit protein bL21m n=1 Tax=Toxocara canis TaxID=6265 RepID=A0A3P7IQK7_TOXCA|nr:unnamed protein product [Toxocara canis]
MRADVLSNWKGKSLTPNFFADLLSEQNEENSSDGTDDDSDGDEQSSEDEDMEESGESNEQVLHKDAVPMQEQQSSDDESMEQIDGLEEGKSQKAFNGRIMQMVGASSQCAFCSQLGSSLYVCPRCQLNYCSLRCYRNEKHRECSEDFYRRCVENELKNTRHESNSGGNKPQTFEEFMSKFLPGADSSLDAGMSNEEGEPLDSDDEDVEYLDKVNDSTLAEFDCVDETEIERRLTAMGIGTDPEQLYAALTDSEKAAFVRLAEQMQCAEFGFGDSIMQKIEAEMADETKRLFAVVYINGRQFKVGENDLITLQDNLPLDVGDKIKLEKVLLLGGQSFTLIGRPLLQSPSVRVNATVVEKTTQAPELKYTMVNHKSIRKLLCTFPNIFPVSFFFSYEDQSGDES